MWSAHIQNAYLWYTKVWDPTAFPHWLQIRWGKRRSTWSIRSADLPTGWGWTFAVWNTAMLIALGRLGQFRSNHSLTFIRLDLFYIQWALGHLYRYGSILRKKSCTEAWPCHPEQYASCAATFWCPGGARRCSWRMLEKQMKDAAVMLHHTKFANSFCPEKRERHSYLGVLSPFGFVQRAFFCDKNSKLSEATVYATFTRVWFSFCSRSYHRTDWCRLKTKLCFTCRANPPAGIVKVPEACFGFGPLALWTNIAPTNFDVRNWHATVSIQSPSRASQFAHDFSLSTCSLT